MCTSSSRVSPKYPYSHTRSSSCSRITTAPGSHQRPQQPELSWSTRSHSRPAAPAPRPDESSGGPQTSVPDRNPPPISDAQREAAERVCEAAGVSGYEPAGCIFDVSMTGDPGFAVTTADFLAGFRPSATTSVALSGAAEEPAPPPSADPPAPGRPAGNRRRERHPGISRHLLRWERRGRHARRRCGHAPRRDPARGGRAVGHVPERHRHGEPVLR